VRRDLTLLRSRRFLLLFSARTSSVLGSSIGPVALAFGVLALPHATATTLSLVLTANSATLLLFLLVGGVIADRLPRHRVMYFSDALSGVSWAVIGVMLLTGWAPIWMLAVMAALAGLGAALFWPAMVGVIPQITPAEQLQQGNGILRIGTNAARILGFAVAGAMVALVGPGWAMLLNAAGFLVSAALLMQLRLPVIGAVEAAHVWSDLREGWREFWSRQWLWVVVLQFSILVAGLEAFYGVLGPYVANERLGGAPAWSVILAGESLGMLAGVVIAIRIRPKRPILLGVLLTFPLALAPLLLGIGAPVPIVAAGAFVGGMSIDIFGVLWDTTMQRSVPEEMLSRISSYDALGSLLFGPIGLIAAGPLVVGLGSSKALLITSASVIVPTALALLAPGVRSMRMPDAPPEIVQVVPAPVAVTG
jgi:MFS family permease